MRTLADPDTGEVYEVLDHDLTGSEPYDYPQFRRAAMTVSREHRKAITDAELAGKALAGAEGAYHKQLAVAVGTLKVAHGSTIAETLAKGVDSVKAAKEARDEAAARDRAAMERVRLCRDDRAVLLTMGAWSRQAGDWNE
jgi:hypothetical protein